MRIFSAIKIPFFITLLILLLLYFCYFIISTPLIGIFIKQDSSGQYIVANVEKIGRAEREGIKPGDIVLSADGEHPSTLYSVRTFSVVEQVNEVTIQRADGKVYDYQFENNWLKNISSQELLFQFILPWMFLLVFAAMSVFIYRKGKKDRSSASLTLFFLSVGITYFSSIAAYRSDPLGKITLFAILPLIPYFFMHFMNVYLERFNVKFINKKLYYILLYINIATGLVHAAFILIDFHAGDISLISRPVMASLIFVGYSICLFCLIHGYLRYRTTRLKALFKILLASHIVAFTPFVTMNLLPLVIFGFELLPATLTTLFILVLPLSFMYLFTSNTLFDIDFILTRFKYYVSIALIPAIVIMLFVTIIESVNYEHYWLKWFQIFIVLYAGVISFLYLKEYIDNKAKPKLFKQMYNFQDSIDRFSAQLTRVMKHSDLEELLKKEFTLMVPLCRYAFLLYNGLNGKMESQDIELPVKHLEEVLLKSSELFKVSSMHQTEKGLILVIGKRKEEFHLIWVENKSNHTSFNVDELRWLKSITHFTSIVHENLYLIENLLGDLESEMNKKQAASPWVLRLLFCLSENERRRLASDLHDSALQDQLIWYRRLETAMLDYKMSNELHVELRNIREGLLDVIYQIRETCNELRPPLLKELGLLEAIESLIEHIQLQVNFAVQFVAEPIQEKLNEEQITSIYRMVQELLRNTAKHARADLVRIELMEKDRYIYMNYKDDGIGMDIDQMKSSFSHMGLSGLKERVSSLEGTIEFVSAKDEGFQVKIIIPTTWTKRSGEREDYIDSYLIS